MPNFASRRYWLNEARYYHRMGTRFGGSTYLNGSAYWDARMWESLFNCVWELGDD